MKKDKWIYWIFTALFVLPMAGGGIPELFSAPAQLLATMAHLGYPPYLLKILGFAKIAGAVAIVSGFSPRLKEWAYAGFAFDLLGASASHFFAGDKTEPFIPLVLLLLMSVSYAYWHRLEEAIGNEQ